MTSANTAIKKNDPRDLRLVTAGQGVSMVGTAISDLAIPIMAVDLLGANSFGTGLLGAATTVGYLVFGLQAGVWIDRLPRRQFLLAADAVRAALLLAIPVLFALNLLTLPLLICDPDRHRQRKHLFQSCMARVPAAPRHRRHLAETQRATGTAR